MSRSRVPRILVGLMICAVAIRLALLVWVVAFGAGVDILSYGDGKGYAALARSISEGAGFTTVNAAGERILQTFRAPGLPILLAPFMWLPHGVVWWGIVLSLLAGMLLPYLTYRIGTAIFDTRVGTVAAFFAAFEPHMVWFSWVTLSEMPFMLFSLSALWLLMRSWHNEVPWRLLLAGGLLGYAILIRPPYLLIFLLLIIAAFVWYLYRQHVASARRICIVFLGVLLVLAPWSIRNYVHTGSTAISGMGWYNVYFDYVSSILAIENKSDFSTEKTKRRDNPPEGVERAEIQNPASAAILKDIAVKEIWEHRATTVKLESALMFTFFTNDSYYYYLRRFGVVHERNPDLKNRSATLALLSRGKDSFVTLFEELQRQYFLPLLGRAFFALVVLLALVGAVAHHRKALVLMFVACIGLTALVSSALGFGLEARLRVPVQPLLFILAAAGVYNVLSLYRHYAHHRLTALNSRI